MIRHQYAETYGEDLLKELDKELTSDFEVCFSLCDFFKGSLSFSMFDVTVWDLCFDDIKDVIFTFDAYEFGI